MRSTLRKKLIAEACERMKLMGVRGDVRSEFEENGTVMLCNYGRFYPIEKSMRDEISQFEREANAVVFLVVRWFTRFGELDALLFVDKYEEEWEMLREDIRLEYAMSYNINRDYPELSEPGSICFYTTKDGCIVRDG